MSSCFSTVVVDDFHVFRSLVGPFEADSILLIDANTRLSFSIPSQSLEAVAWRYPQILEGMRLIELIQLASRYRPQLDGTAFLPGRGAGAVENISSALTSEGPNHGNDRNV